MADSHRPLLFSGTDGIECEEFIHAVRQFALAAGKARDDDWIADFASCCFVGEALRWHIKLDEETRHDWQQLQNALITEYPSPPDRTSCVGPAKRGPLTGIIRVIDIGNDEFKFLSRIMDKEGRFGTTTMESEALRVQFTASDNHFRVQILNSSPAFERLGIRFYKPNVNWGTDRWDRWGCLCGVSATGPSADPGYWDGPAQSNGWTLAEVNSAFGVCWISSNGTPFPLDIALDSGKEFCFVNGYDILPEPEGWKKAQLFFKES